MISVPKNRMERKLEQPICGFGCCLSQNGKFQPQDSIEGMFPSGTKNYVNHFG